jgi:GTP-binding protein
MRLGVFGPFRVGQERGGFFPWVSPTAIRIFPLWGNILDNSAMVSKETPWEIHSAEFVLSAVRRRHYPQPSLPQVAFSGRSNCGKSSLLNCLVRRKNLAKTSGKPGHTRLVNFFQVETGSGEHLHFVDLPGYGYAKAPPAEKEKWRRSTEEFLKDNPHLRLMVLLLDARRTPSELDDVLVEFLKHLRIPFLLVLTKSDKLGRAELEKSRKAIAAHYALPKGQLPIATSAEKGTGREELLKRIRQALLDRIGNKEEEKK